MPGMDQPPQEPRNRRRRSSVLALLVAVAVLSAGTVVLFQAVTHRPNLVSSTTPTGSPAESASPGTSSRPSPSATTPSHGATPSPKPSPKPTPKPPPAAFFPKGLFVFHAPGYSGSQYAQMASEGFNTLTDGSNASTLATYAGHGLKGFAWLGSYYNATCSWQYSDAQVTSMVKALKGNTRVIAYQLGDEPNHFSCPGAPTQYAHRTAVVHAADSHAKTFVVSDEFNDPVYNDYNKIPKTSVFKGKVDILAFDIYPCQDNQTCTFNMIKNAVRVIKAMRLPQWWAVIQDFHEDGWRWPTASELLTQYQLYEGSGLTGLMVYAWDANGATQPQNLSTLKQGNALFPAHR